MPLEQATWVYPAVEGAIKHREEIMSLWAKIEAKLFGERKTIAFTGHAGVGKTVLFDHLTGKAFAQGYKPPGESVREEDEQISAVHKRILLATIPGQQTGPRFKAIDNLFRGQSSVDGVVHVVANGFIEPRSDDLRKDLIFKGVDTLAKYREVQISSELQDLEQTCAIVREALRTHRKPTWLLVAVTKLDLFYDDVGSIRSYYSPENLGSAFAQRLNRLRNQVGEDNFRWLTVPVCCRPEPFTWNADTVQPQLGTE